MDQLLPFIKENLVLISALLTIIWFYWTEKHKPRLEFDINCKFINTDNANKDYIAEVQLILSNNGYVNKKLNKLELSVHTLEDYDFITEKEESKDIVFNKRILKRQSVIPDNWVYWVRPNVKQVFTKIIKIEGKCPVVRVTAGFSYGLFGDSKHTSQRVFQVAQQGNKSA